jgi:hypothetical protein
MTLDLADKVAKLLRVACSTGPDGEKLAALNRLSALAVVHGFDWDRAVANSNGSGLNEEVASRIYWEGHARGCAETEQRLRPERDWKVILAAAAESRDAGLLSDWEVTFSDDMRERFERYGWRLYVSERQWQSLDRLETKLKRQSFID